MSDTPKPQGHKPTFNVGQIVMEGHTVHLPHAGVTLRRIIEFAAAHHTTHKGSRYYEVMFNGVHLAKVAVPRDKLN